MLFSSMVFVFLFLPVTFVVYFSVKSLKVRNTIIALFSVFFYAWGEPKYVMLMLITLLHNFILAIYIDKNIESGKPKIAKFLIVLSCFLNLGCLVYFKYIDFIIENINFAIRSNIPITNTPLPIGISFYTFQIMSYTIDVYRRKVKVQRNLIYLTAYLAFFPQLIAGPIVNYATIENELNSRTHDISEIANGFRRFIIGLGKKLIIANNMAIIIDHYIEYGVDRLTMQMAWVGIIAYAFQIYFDFSAYSDMAIGMGRMFGFHFLENFDYPYMSKSVTEFWRRWHISLGTWFRDYLYIPLGGNRVGKFRWFINIIIVWFLTGLWHGASWNFILWGLWYGLFLILEKLFLLNIYKKLPGFFSWAITFVITLFGWVLFRLDNTKDIISYFKALFHLNGAEIFSTGTLQLGEYFPYFMFIFAVISITPAFKNIYVRLITRMRTLVLADVYLVIILALSISFLLRNTYNPFIYFRF